MNWHNWEAGESVNYVCGYCGSDITSNIGYFATEFITGATRKSGDLIRVCHKCHKPSYIDSFGRVIPSAIYGKSIAHLPKDIEMIYDEARRCFGINAYTSVIMCCRKLLMHIACENGADENLAFGKYVQYLKENGFITRPAHKLAETILQYGNIANHKLEVYDKNDAMNIMLFSEMILKNIYELPAIHAALEKK